MHKVEDNAMNELIKVRCDESDTPVISGRELHGFLEVGTQYTIWFDRMVDYGFECGKDWQTVNQKRLTAQGNETTYTDHQLTIPMAKEISMLQRTEKGKLARQYFLLIFA